MEEWERQLNAPIPGLHHPSSTGPQPWTAEDEMADFWALGSG